VASGTRDRLIRTTSRLLRKQGYAGTGLNQVMAEAEAPKGSMYFHFPGGKQELAAAAVDSFAERTSARMAEDLAAARTVGEAVTKFFDAYIAHLERTEFLEGCAVATVAVEAAPTHKTLGDATGRALRGWTDLLAEALRAEGHPASRAHGLATLVLAALEGGIVMSKGQGSTEPLAAARDTLRALLTLDGAERPARSPGPRRSGRRVRTG
jgi:TetR/AcrR family transcriptional regulator, lmrAB and yxaGH operons repressor